MLFLLLGLVDGDDFVGARCPGAFAEDGFDVGGEDDLALVELVGEACVAFLVLGEDVFGALILLGEDARDFLVDDLGALFGVGLGEAVVLAG